MLLDTIQILHAIIRQWEARYNWLKTNVSVTGYVLKRVGPHWPRGFESEAQMLRERFPELRNCIRVPEEPNGPVKVGRMELGKVEKFDQGEDPGPPEES